MEPKKIAFGFSKTNKKPILSGVGVSAKVTGSKSHKDEGEKIELISCVEENAIKIVGKEHDDGKPVQLVIPLREKDKKTIPDRLAKLLEIKNEKELESTTVKNETLEQKAAREILEDLKQAQQHSLDQENVVVLLKPEDLPLEGAQESTLDDYESIPIEQFGLAMLRGMGWKGESKDVKASDKLPDGPIARPKGLGLGAERPNKNKNQPIIPPSKGEVLTMRPGALVKVLTGKFADFYGTVESLNEETSRALVRFALGRSQEYVNEHLLLLVSKAEFDKFSKVLNSAKYEEYKNKPAPVTVKEEKKEIIEVSSSPEPTARYRDRQTDRKRRSRSRSRSSSRDRKRKTYDSRQRSPPRRQRKRGSSEDSDEAHDRDRYKHKSRKDDRKHRSDEDDRYPSKKSHSDKGRDRDQRRRSRSVEKRRDKRYDSSSDSDDSSDHRYSKSKKNKYERKRERSRDRRHSSEEDDRHHKKKSKKSKKKKDHRRS